MRPETMQKAMRIDAENVSRETKDKKMATGNVEKVQKKEKVSKPVDKTITVHVKRKLVDGKEVTTYAISEMVHGAETMPAQKPPKDEEYTDAKGAMGCIANKLGE